MLSEDKKIRINSLTMEEMINEINLGNRSRYQREAFAYLKTRYELRSKNVMSTPNTTPTSKTLLFLGSSTAAKSQAKAVAAALQSAEIEFLPWWEAFTPGRTLLEELDNIRGKVQGAVLLFSPEAASTVRGKAVQVPNLNVLFEFGYFYGHFGKQKVALLKYGEFYLPSDFGGYIHIAGSKSFKRSTAMKIGKRTITDFERWVFSAGFATSFKPENANVAAKVDQAEISRRASALVRKLA